MDDETRESNGKVVDEKGSRVVPSRSERRTTCPPVRKFLRRRLSRTRARLFGLYVTGGNTYFFFVRRNYLVT